MANTAVRAFTAIDAPEMVRDRIEEHIQEKVGKIHEKKAAAKGRLRRFIRFLLSCEAVNPYDLSPEIQARLFL